METHPNLQASSKPSLSSDGLGTKVQDGTRKFVFFVSRGRSSQAYIVPVPSVPMQHAAPTAARWLDGTGDSALFYSVGFET